MNLEFKGKVALITGASSGIGRATALAFGRKGASVACLDIQEDGGMKTCRMIEEAGGKAIFLKCDVAKDSDVRGSIEKVEKAFGRLDFAFNNAGTEGLQAFTTDCSEANWNCVIDTNLKGVWLCMKYQIPLLLKQKGGAIINCSSVAGLVGFPSIPAYVASKHGVIGLTKTAALEFAKQGIRINAICPGVIQTPMIDRFSHGEAQIQKQLVEGEPVGRIGNPEEVASAVLWLCSEGASFTTGTAIPVDGGWTAQ